MLIFAQHVVIPSPSPPHAHIRCPISSRVTSEKSTVCPKGVGFPLSFDLPEIKRSLPLVPWQIINMSCTLCCRIVGGWVWAVTNQQTFGQKYLTKSLCNPGTTNARSQSTTFLAPESSSYLRDPIGNGNKLMRSSTIPKNEWRHQPKH